MNDIKKLSDQSLEMRLTRKDIEELNLLRILQNSQNSQEKTLKNVAFSEFLKLSKRH